MSKRTSKIGITGKYGVRYGSSIRKQLKKIEISQRKKYNCLLCGSISIKRQATGIWYCKKCKVTFAGGAWSLITESGLTAKATLKRIKDL